MKKLSKNDYERVLQDIFDRYMSPAFGCLTKKETDLMIFKAMLDCRIIDIKDDPYELASTLKITRTKVRNLVYETTMRMSDETQLSKELEELLMSELVYVAEGKIGLEIINPFLSDYVRSKLKKLKHITDGSFSPELVRLSPTAYYDLCKNSAPEIARKLDEIREKEVLLKEFNTTSEFITDMVRETKIPFAGAITKWLFNLSKNSKKEEIEKMKKA